MTLTEELAELRAKLDPKDGFVITQAIQKIEALEADSAFWYQRATNPPEWAQDSYGAPPSWQ